MDFPQIGRTGQIHADLRICGDQLNQHNLRGSLTSASRLTIFHHSHQPPPLNSQLTNWPADPEKFLQPFQPFAHLLGVYVVACLKTQPKIALETG